MGLLSDRRPVENVGHNVIAIDGKTSRRSGSKRAGPPALHMVSAFAARQRLVHGQVAVAEKSNEIVAIPKLIDMMAIEGAVVTIDAIECQRDVAQKILDKKADYGPALKGNQVSITAALGLGSRPTCARSIIRAISQMVLIIRRRVSRRNHR